MKISKRANLYLQDMKPWEFVKTNIERSATVMNVAVNAIYLLAILLEPFMPSFTSKLCMQINYAVEDGDLANYEIDRTADKRSKEERLNALLVIKPGHQIGQPQPLFRQITDAEVTSWREKFSGQAKNVKPNVDFPFTCVVGTVVKCEDHPTAPHLYLLSVDCGEEAPRTIVSGLKPQYNSAEELVDRQVVLLTNIRPSNFKGVKSEGLLLTSFKTKVSLLGLVNKTRVKNGTRVLPEGAKHVPKDKVEPKSEFKKWKMDTGENGVALFENCEWIVDGTDVRIVADNGLQGAKIQ
jgi:methionyl-tRNA synthetase